ncbi:hypothetical protein P4O66_005622, partial [Electrophorus voltai]
RPQSVRVGNCASSTLTLSTGAPQGCVLSPLLYSLYTYNCTATSSSIIIVKFADDTVVMGLISDNDERAYLEEIKHLENWCQENNLLLNVSKTKELIVNCSKKQEWHYQPVRISGTTVERVDSFRYLGVHISQDLSWSLHTNSLAKKARQRLYHLRRLRDFRLPSKVLRNFYTCTIESILTGNITVWFGNSTKQDRQALQRVVHSAERITHTELPDLQTIYYKQCQTKARRIVKDPTHPNNRLFSLLSQTMRTGTQTWTLLGLTTPAWTIIVATLIIERKGSVADMGSDREEDTPMEMEEDPHGDLPSHSDAKGSENEEPPAPKALPRAPPRACRPRSNKLPQVVSREASSSEEDTPPPKAKGPRAHTATPKPSGGKKAAAPVPVPELGNTVGVLPHAHAPKPGPSPLPKPAKDNPPPGWLRVRCLALESPPLLGGPLFRNHPLVGRAEEHWSERKRQ